MKYLARINKTKLFDVLFIVLILASFAIKMTSFDYPALSYAGGTGEDYLVASLIVQDNNFPLTGAASGASQGKLYNSPVYYYLMGSFLAIHNDIMFLELASIILWLFSISFVYLLGKHAFGPAQGLIAATLFSIFSIIDAPPSHIRNTFMMQPFVYLSYLLLFLSYIRSNYILVLASIFVFIFSVALYNSAFGILPFFMVVVLLILRKKNKSILHYGGALLATVGSFLLIYFPVFLYLAKERELKPYFTNLMTFEGSPLFLLSDFFSNLLGQIEGFSFVILTFFPGGSMDRTIFLFLFFPSIVLYFVLKKGWQKKVYMSIMMLAVVQQLIVISLLKDPDPGIYLVPIVGLFFIATAEILYSIFSKNMVLKVAGIALILFFAYGFTDSVAFHQIKQSKTGHLQIFRVMDTATDAMVNKIITLQQKEGFPDFTFFQVESYTPEKNGQDPNSAALLILLEKKLNKKFTKLVFGGQTTITQTNNNYYVFIACYWYESPPTKYKDCIERFLKSRPNYILDGKIFSQEFLSIYMAKRLNDANANGNLAMKK